MSVAVAHAQLDDVQRAVLEDLRRDGIALIPFTELFGDTSLWDELLADVGEFVRETEPRAPELLARADPKAYIVRRFPTSTRYAPDDRRLAAGLSSRVLDVVNAYRGEWLKLVAFDQWYTIPDASAANRVASQQWHRDPWDNHIVKVFTYFNDVDVEAGPFEYVRGSPAGGRYGHLWPWVDAVELGVYPPDDELAAAVDPADIVTATGRAGTMIFCDTSGFHRGGWARTKRRVLSWYAYVAPGANTKQRFKIDRESDGSDLSPAARFAIGAAGAA